MSDQEVTDRLAALPPDTPLELVVSPRTPADMDRVHNALREMGLAHTMFVEGEEL